MGRERSEASPVKVAAIGDVAMAPMISRTPVPELVISQKQSGFLQITVTSASMPPRALHSWV